MACFWNGLYFVFSGAGTYGSGHVDYMDQALAEHAVVWKIVSWHKNQRLMQIGGKTDEVGWDTYDTARKYGAIIATGHEHSYCRSHLMSDFRTQRIATTNQTLHPDIGETFVFVSGLAGKDIRAWDETLKNNPWWAAVGAWDNGITDGVLLCTFNVNGVLRNAHCEQHDRFGRLWDRFDIVSHLPDTQEELDRKLQQFETTTKETHCKNPFIEVPVSHASHDVEEDQDGILSCHSSITKIGKSRFAKGDGSNILTSSTTGLRFEGVPLKKSDKIQHAYLQVYGAHTNAKTPKFVIKGSSSQEEFQCGGNLPKKDQLSKLSLTDATTIWEHDDEDWEIHTVWVSSDLKDIVSEIINQSEWQEGNAITLVLTGEGERSFYAFDRSPCFAPTLAIELEEQC